MRLALRATMVVLMAALLLAGAPSRVQTVHSDTEDFADLGDVEVLHAGTAAADLLLLLDDAQADAHDLARQLARQGHWVAYIKSQNLFDNATQHRDACLDPTTLLDVFSQHVQKKYRFPRYQKPILIGYRQAAALAYATLAQAPERLFAAGIGIDFCPTLAQPVPPCQSTGALRWTNAGPTHYRLQPAPQLQIPWTQLNTGQANCIAQDQQAFGADARTAETLISRIDALIAPATASNANTMGPSAVDDLPLVELPAPNDKGDFFVVLLSGDGGWANIDKDIGSALNREGLPVVGWNSLQYFCNRKTPASASADLQRVINHYRQVWHKDRVLLIGFSLGADVLPFMVSRLPSAERAQIVDIALLSASHSVDFEFHVTAWLGSNKGDTHQIAPELKKLSEPILCLYGSDDDDTLCKDFKATNVTNASLPGDHHYQGDFQSVTKLILEHLRKIEAR